MKLPISYENPYLLRTLEDKTSESDKRMNRSLERIFKRYNVKTILDLSCGTGSQVFWFTKRRYDIIGVDISNGSLNFARRKARRLGVKAKLFHGDMRTSKMGSFDAVVTIFNAVGHLTKPDFEKAMRNIRSNLNDRGIYVFDILNLHMNDRLKAELDATEEIRKTVGDTELRRIQKCRLDRKRSMLWTYDWFYAKKGSGKAKTQRGTGHLRVYAAKELRDMLKRSGFKVLGQYALYGSRFSETGSDRILTVAQRF